MLNSGMDAPRKARSLAELLMSSLATTKFFDSDRSKTLIREMPKTDGHCEENLYLQGIPEQVTSKTLLAVAAVYYARQKFKLNFLDDLRIILKKENPLEMVAVTVTPTFSPDNSYRLTSSRYSFQT